VHLKKKSAFEDLRNDFNVKIFPGEIGATVILLVYIFFQTTKRSDAFTSVHKIGNKLIF